MHVDAHDRCCPRRVVRMTELRVDDLDPGRTKGGGRREQDGGGGGR